MKNLGFAVVGALIPTIIITVAAFIWNDVLIDSQIVPVVTDSLKKTGYIRDDIKDGRFVAADLDAFGDNHPIKPDILRNLREGKYITQDYKPEFEKRTSDLLDRVDSRLNELNDVRKEITLIKARQDGRFKVTLYIDEKNDDLEGRILLNSSNFLVSQTIKNNEYYYFEDVGGNNKERYKVILRDLTIDKKPSSAAVGRLYIDDHNELFEGARSSEMSKSYVMVGNR